MDEIDWWSGLLDVGGSADPARVARSPWQQHLVGSVLVVDTDLPGLTPAAAPGDEPGPWPVPLTVVVSGGAGQVAGPVRLASRRGLQVAAVRVVLRDLDDLRGNARRVVAALDAAEAEGALDEAVVVQVGLPATPPGADWLAALDEVAALELALALPCGDAPADTVAAWLEAALDRETPVCAASGDPVRLLAATRRCLDGAGGPEVAAALTAPHAAVLAGLDAATLARTRRWLTRVGCDAGGPERLAASLAEVGVVER